MHYNVLSQFVENVIEKIVKGLVNKKMLVSQTNQMPRMAKITWLSVMALAMTASFSQCGHKYGLQRKVISDTNQSQKFQVPVVQQKQWVDRRLTMYPRKVVSKWHFKQNFWTARPWEAFWYDWRVWRECISKVVEFARKPVLPSHRKTSVSVIDCQLETGARNHHCEFCRRPHGT